jgi:hypothetical protein
MTNWAAVACSADGSKLVAAVGVLLEPGPAIPGPIYISSDFGSTWTPSMAPIMNWDALACSADGSKVLAAVGRKDWHNPGPICLSTNSGVSWVATGASATNWWAGLALSADGTRAAAVVPRSQYLPGGIYNSADGGITWSLAAGTDDYWSFWVAVAGSGDGARLIAANYANSTIAISTNFGATWFENYPGVSSPHAVCSSADGQKLMVASPDGGIATSTNGGLSWAATSAPALQWVSVASSADGTRLVAVPSYYYNAGRIWTSTNSGTSWAMANAPVANWTSVASSADGCKLVATTGGSPGLIYTSQTPPQPRLNISRFDHYILLSWTVPSMNFVLQQNSDFTASNWTDVAVPPTLNHTNLQYEVSLAVPSQSMFFRLVSR